MIVKRQIGEISLYSGVMDRTVESEIIGLLNMKLSGREIINKLRKFASRLAIDLSTVDDNELLDYWGDVENNGTVPKVKKKKLVGLTKNSFWSSFIYYLVKTNFKLKKYDDLEFIKKNNNYYFFDADIEDYIGFIVCDQLKDIGQRFKFPIKKSASVVVSSAIHGAFKGQGYGKKMYLAVIEDAGCLLSDTGLYPESLNIWVNVLPKYVKYVGFVDINGDLKKMKGPIEKYSDTIERFFATNDPSFLKLPIE
jgi:hypothetical protein